MQEERYDFQTKRKKRRIILDDIWFQDIQSFNEDSKSRFFENSTLIKRITFGLFFYKRQPNNIIYRNRLKEAVKMNKLNHEEFLEKVLSSKGSDYLVLSDYINTKTKVKVRHICGYEYDVTPNHLLNGRNCPSCGGGIRNKTTDIFKNEVEKLVSKDYIVIGEYVGVKDKIKIKHVSECDYEFEMRPGDFLRGQRCPKCSRKKAIIKNTKTQEEFSQEIKDLTKEEYELVSNYYNNKIHVSIKHKSCGKEYEVLPVNFLKGNRCPHCAFISSNGEEEVFSFIKSIYNGEMISGNKGLIDGKQEVDIYLPEKNIAFEYDGLYWHSEKQGKNKNYHKDKTEKLSKKGIRLIHIFEDEWLFKKEIVKSKIKHILRLNTNEKIYARNCIVKKIDDDLKNNFLSLNHIQGRDMSSIRIGLFRKEELVAVMTFSKTRPSLGRKSSKMDYELVRYASSKDYLVIGAFGKLINYFKVNYNFNTIVTYADLRWSQESNVYEISDFKLKHKSEPNYWYFKPSELIRYHRYNFRKDNLKNKFPHIFSKEKTEIQMMTEMKYERIYDCGNLVYEMKKE